MQMAAITYKALFFDLSGVIYTERQLLPGAIQAISNARQRGLLLRFVTNTASQDESAIITLLAELGIHINSSELYTAPKAALDYLELHRLRPFLLVHSSIHHLFEHLDQHEPNCVVLGDAREALGYRTLNQAFQLLNHGAAFIGIGMNRYFMTNNGLQLDAGPFIHALEWATGISPLIMGKPNKTFFDQVVASTPYQASECMMIGDDVYGDIEGAINANLQAALVTTGKYENGDENKIEGQFLILNSLQELFN